MLTDPRSPLDDVPLSLLVPFLSCCDLVRLLELSRAVRLHIIQGGGSELVLRYGLPYTPKQPNESAVSVLQSLCHSWHGWSAYCRATPCHCCTSLFFPHLFCSAADVSAPLCTG